MAEKTMEVVMFEPGKKPYVKTIPDTLEGWQTNVGVIGEKSYVQIVNMVIRVGNKKKSVKVFMDEEGKLKHYVPCIKLKNEHGFTIDFVAGTCFVTLSYGLGTVKKLKENDIEFIKKGIVMIG